MNSLIYLLINLPQVQSVQKFLILDLGSQHIKAGFSGEGYPRFILPSVVAYNKKEPNAPPVFAYDALNHPFQQNTDLIHPFQQKTISEGIEWDWESARDLISSVINHLKIDPRDYHVLYIEPLHSGRINTEPLIELLKVKFSFPEVFVYKQHILTLQEMRKRSALILELGHSMSSIIAYYKGYEIKPSTKFFLIAGKLIAEKFAKKLELDLAGEEVSPYEVIRLIDKYFYVPRDYEQELKDYNRDIIKDIDALLPLTRRSITIEDERFTLPEAIFHPDLVGSKIEGGGLQNALREAINEIPIDTRPEILENVILSGGLSKLKGLKIRIYEELKKMFPNLKINIITHERREVTAWMGADTLCTGGAPVADEVHKRFLDYQLPEIISQFYEETIRCEKSQLWLATSVLIKRTLNAVMQDLANQRISFTTVMQDFKHYEIVADSYLSWVMDLKILRNLDSPPAVEHYTQVKAAEEIDYLQAILEILYKYYPRLKQKR